MMLRVARITEPSQIRDSKCAIQNFGWSPAHWRLVTGICYASLCQPHGPVAQRLEQGTHNPLVPGSNPGGPSFGKPSKTTLTVTRPLFLEIDDNRMGARGPSGTNYLVL